KSKIINSSSKERGQKSLFGSASLPSLHLSSLLFHPTNLKDRKVQEHPRFWYVFRGMLRDSSLASVA
ncbi:hypothetical protein BHE74_00057372, partial [Ensete ventricosum]